MNHDAVLKNDRIALAYERLLSRLERRRQVALSCSARFTRWRIAIFLTGSLSVTVSAFWDPARGGWIPLALFGVVFFAVARAHSRLKTKMRRLDAWIALKRTHLARVRLDWSAIPNIMHAAPDNHPYAADLDIVGPRSLLRWLDTTVSTVGRSELTTWLLSPDADEFEARRRLIRELQPFRLFRDRLILQVALVSKAPLDGERITTALAQEEPPRLATLFAVELTLAALTASLLTASLVTGFPGYWVLSLIAYGGIFWWAGPRLASVFNRAVELETDLAPFAQVFAVVERRVYRSTPELASVLAPFIEAPSKPSTATRRLAGLVAALNIRAHPLAHLAVNLVVPWDLWFAERFRLFHHEIANRLPIWITRLGRIEAAAALAQYADTHPEYTYPALALREDEAKIHIEVKGIGHPLLPSSSRVTNDFALTGLGATAIITGSNMSGKSTFLRTLGVNLCLAEAGAPVCATSWTSPWMRLYCCIRVEDSLDGGISYFYAEVKRLKRLLDAARERDRPPVFFLIDEIFRGTNNRERLIGSRHYVRALGESHGLGLVSTHDLELVKLEGESDRITTHHFRETVDEGGLVFDYRLRPGPCPTTNALKIMAREGLPVPEESDPPSIRS
jgi:hypothetical protein